LVTASAVVIGFALLQWRGIRIGDATQQLTSLLKSLALMALAGVALVMPIDSRPLVPVTALAPTGVALVGAVIIALQSAIYTYDGWTGPIYFGEELRDPARDIPRAMIGGVLLVLVIYLLLNAAFLRVVPIADMAGDPFVAATAAARLFGPTGDTVIRIVMLLSLVAAVNALQLMAARVPFAMSRDRLLPLLLRRVNPGGTPVPALVASTLIALACIATNTFNTVLAMLAFLFVANYGLTFIALFASRRRWPDAPRPFRVPGYPFVPGLALTGSLAFMVAAVVSDRTNSMRSLALLGISWPVYLLIRPRTSARP
jgi:APA family basic amino acid/polyamine antiporter